VAALLAACRGHMKPLQIPTEERRRMQQQLSDELEAVCSAHPSAQATHRVRSRSTLRSSGFHELGTRS
jgi:hypothetical protein